MSVGAVLVLHSLAMQKARLGSTPVATQRPAM